MEKQKTYRSLTPATAGRRLSSRSPAASGSPSPRGPEAASSFPARPSRAASFPDTSTSAPLVAALGRKNGESFGGDSRRASGGFELSPCDTLKPAGVTEAPAAPASIFNRLRASFCRIGFHDSRTATFLGIGDLEITGKKNHPPLVLSGDYRVFLCVCGETFTTGLAEAAR